MFRQDRLAKERHVLARCGQVWQDRPVKVSRVRVRYGMAGKVSIGLVGYGKVGQGVAGVERCSKESYGTARYGRQGLED